MSLCYTAQGCILPRVCKLYCTAFCTPPDLRGTDSTVPPAFLSHQSNPSTALGLGQSTSFPCLASCIETPATTKDLRVHLVETDIVPVNSSLSILSYNFKQISTYTKLPGIRSGRKLGIPAPNAMWSQKYYTEPVSGYSNSQ